MENISFKFEIPNIRKITHLQACVAESLRIIQFLNTKTMCSILKFHMSRMVLIPNLRDQVECRMQMMQDVNLHYGSIIRTQETMAEFYEDQKILLVNNNNPAFVDNYFILKFDSVDVMRVYGTDERFYYVASNFGVMYTRMNTVFDHFLYRFVDNELLWYSHNALIVLNFIKKLQPLDIDEMYLTTFLTWFRENNGRYFDVDPNNLIARPDEAREILFGYDQIVEPAKPTYHQINSIVKFYSFRNYYNGIIIGFKIKDKIFSSQQEFDDYILENPLIHQQTAISYGIVTLHNLEHNEADTYLKEGKIIFHHDVRYVADMVKNSNYFYNELSNSGVIKMKLNEDISASIAMFGVAKIRTMIQQDVSSFIFIYKQHSVKIKETKENYHCATVINKNDDNNKKYKFLVSDCKLLLPNLKGYNIPKNKSIKAGSIVRLIDNSHVRDTYVINKISRYKESKRMANCENDLQTHDVLNLINQSTKVRLNVMAQNVKLISND